MEPENLSKILDDLKNRFASRFIFSFIIAWLIYNWQITVALFWYDKSQIHAEGCKSIFEFISNQLNNNSNSSKAFWTALIYTFGLPISKSVINIWDEIIFDLRNWSKTKLVRSQDAKTIKQLKDKLRKVDDMNILNGKWKKISTISTLSYGDNLSADVIRFLKGNCFIDNENSEKYIVHDFLYSTETNRVVFLLKTRTSPDVTKKLEDIKPLIFILSCDEYFTTLEGTVNGNKIKLVRQDV